MLPSSSWVYMSLFSPPSALSTGSRLQTQLQGETWGPPEELAPGE